MSMLYDVLMNIAMLAGIGFVGAIVAVVTFIVYLWYREDK